MASQLKATAIVMTYFRRCLSLRRLTLFLGACLGVLLVRSLTAEDLRGESEPVHADHGFTYTPYRKPKQDIHVKFMARPAEGNGILKQPMPKTREDSDMLEEISDVQFAKRARRQIFLNDGAFKEAEDTQNNKELPASEKPLTSNTPGVHIPNAGIVSSINSKANRGTSGKKHLADDVVMALKAVSVGLRAPTTIPLPLVERVDGNYSRKPYLFVSAFGRFGNHLFEYASMYGLARDLDRQPVITDEMEDLTQVFQNVSAPLLKSPWNNETRIQRVTEKLAGVYSLQLLTLPRQDVEVCCFLQSWKYFARYERELRQQLVFREPMRSRAQSAIDGHIRDYISKVSRDTGKVVKPGEVTVVGLHVRRDDVAREKEVSRGYKPAPTSYIRKAIRYYRNNYQNTLFLVCSDDMRWCREHLPLRGPSLHLVEPASPDDLAILSLCNHTIMTVGTFGWWAAWLAGGEVVYYRNWPTPRTEIGRNYVPDDYFPKHWTPMED